MSDSLTLLNNGLTCVTNGSSSNLEISYDNSTLGLQTSSPNDSLAISSSQNIDLSSNNLNINFDASLNVISNTGDMTFYSADGDININSSNGNVTVQSNLTGDVTIYSASISDTGGTVQISGFSTDLNGNNSTVGGNVIISALNSATNNYINGNVTITATQNNGSANAVGGNITLSAINSNIIGGNIDLCGNTINLTSGNNINIDGILNINQGAMITGGSCTLGTNYTYINNLNTIGSIDQGYLVLENSNQICLYNPNSSSIKLKDNVEPLPDSKYNIDTFMKLIPVQFTWKSDNTSSIGFIAEEVNELSLTELVQTDDKCEVTGFKYPQMTSFITKIVQTQQKQIESQQNEINLLKKQVAHLLEIINNKQ